MKKYYVLFDGAVSAINPDDYDSTLKLLQDAVEGHIERIPINALEEHYIDAWCNEECLFQEKPLSMLLYHDKKLVSAIKGNIVFSKTDGEGETFPLTSDDVRKIGEVFEMKKMVDDFGVHSVLVGQI